MKRIISTMLMAVFIMSAPLTSFADIPALPPPGKAPARTLAWSLIALGILIIVITVIWYKKKK